MNDAGYVKKLFSILPGLLLIGNRPNQTVIDPRAQCLISWDPELFT